jgi:hypothetical protein
VQLYRTLSGVCHSKRPGSQAPELCALWGIVAAPSTSLPERIGGIRWLRDASMTLRALCDLGDYGNEAALSPSRSRKPTAPILLLHGREDNVIPAVKSQALADDLRGHAPVRLLLTNLVSHPKADRPAHLLDVYRLIAFWRDLLAHAPSDVLAAGSQHLPPISR